LNPHHLVGEDFFLYFFRKNKLKPKQLCGRVCCCPCPPAGRFLLKNPVSYETGFFVFNAFFYDFFGINPKSCGEILKRGYLYFQIRNKCKIPIANLSINPETCGEAKKSRMNIKLA